MWRAFAIVSWIIVFGVAGYLLVERFWKKPEIVTSAPAGPLFKQLPWKHLPEIEPFELKASDGSKFDSADLTGRPYAVNFFYSTCPTICRQFNEQVSRLVEQFRTDDLTFLSITVDPETDTPQRLVEYQKLFDAPQDHWKFLTGDLSSIQQLGDQSFQVRLQKEIHTEEILLVDRWGRFRDRFRWDDPAEMRRFARVAQEVLRESEPPMNADIETRNLMAGIPHSDEFTPIWLREFFLRTTDDKLLYSRDLIGEVWIGSIFFSTCTTHCVEQNQYLRDLQDRLGDRKVRILSVSTDPQTDTPAQLKKYAQEIKAQPDRWIFLTADDKRYADRVANEYLGLYSQGSDHGTLLAVVDRWGRVRQKFDWRDPAQETAMLQLIDDLNAETRPTFPHGERLSNAAMKED